MFLKTQKRTLAFLLALILLLSTFMSVAVFPASAAEVDEASTSASYSYLNGAVTIESSATSDAGMTEVVDSEAGTYDVTANAVHMGDMTSSNTVTLSITNNTNNYITYNYDATDIVSNILNTATIGYGNFIDYEEKSDTGSYMLAPHATDEWLLDIYVADENEDLFYAHLVFSDFEEHIRVDGAASVYYKSYSTNIEAAEIYVNDEPIDSNPTPVAYTAAEGITLEAEMESGYGFLAWVDQTGKELSSENPATIYPETRTIKIYPLTYAKDGSADNYGVKIPAYTNEAKFATLSAALAYPSANAANRKITVLNNVDYTEQCTIPSGTTLLVPFDDAHTVYGATPEVVRSHSTPSAYKTLTMKTGSSLTVADGGSIELGGKLSATGQNQSSWNGTPSGPDGRIHMEGTSKITVGNGGNLYAWGYIYGDASIDDIKVEAESGATVYELFQIRGWRGGSASLDCANNGMFPFNQYYIQNIEVPLQLNSGATEMVYSAVNASGNAFPTSIEFIGENGMFVIDEGYLVKDFDEANDRLVIESHANATLGGLTVSLQGFGEMSTSDFSYLPMTNNITIDIKEGTVSVEENIALLPGTQMIVDEGADVVISEESSVYVMDSSQWGDYAIAGAPMNAVGYSAANGTTTVRTSADLVDASVDINGSVEVYGAFMTQSEGSDVHSSGNTGTITYCSDVSTTSISCSDQSGTEANPVEVPFVAANIKQPDGSYITLGVDNAGDEALGVYGFSAQGVALTEQMYRVTWYPYDYAEEAYDPETALASVICKVGDVPVFEGEVPETPEDDDQYTFGNYIGWATAPYTVEAAVLDGEDFPAVGNADVNYYVAYSAQENMYTVKWYDNGTLKATSDPMTYTQTLSAVYPNDPPQSIETKDKTFNHNDAKFSDFDSAVFAGLDNQARVTTSAFNGWNDPEYNKASGVCTINADRTDSSKYLVLWVNENKTERVSYGYYSTSELVDPSVVPVPEKAGYVGHWKNLYTDEQDTPTAPVNCYSTNSSAQAKIPQNVYVAVYEEVPDGFYIVGSMNSWTPSDGYKLVKNESSSDNEYYLEDVHFDAGAEFKVKEKGGTGYWYPNGDNNNCVIHEEGIYDVYFRPDGDGGDGWFYNVIFVKKQMIEKHSLSLDGSIGVNFYVNLPDDAVPSVYTMDFSWGNKYISTNTYSETETYTKTGVTYSGIKDGLYKFTLQVAPKELNDTITATLKCSGEAVATEDYSGTTYAYDLLAKSDEDLAALSRTGKAADLKSIVITMLNYCAAAQKNFAYHTGDLANKDLSADDQTLEPIADNAFAGRDYSIENLPAYLSYYGSLLNLGSETSYMVIFRNDALRTVTASALYTNSETELTTAVKNSSNATGINLLNIPAAKVTSDIDLTIYCSSDEYKATVNPVSYIKAVLAGNYAADLKNVMTALYWYNQAAVTYFA